MDKILLEVENLNCGYDNNFFLTGISFKIKEGEILGIVGPNGSGKTTLLRAITKVINFEGKILFKNKDIKKMSFNEIAQKIGIVSQINEVWFDMKVEEIVSLGRIPFIKKLQFFETKKDEEIIKNVMILTDIYQFRERFITELSGGERQLVFIAKVLAQQPELILLDEPTTHLDIAHQIKILNVIKKLNIEKKVPVIIVLHDLNLASEYCNRLILLNNGRIHKIGRAKGVLTSQNIKAVYKTSVIVKRSPVSSSPYIYVMPDKNS